MEGLEDLLSSCLSNLKSGRGCEYNEVRYHDFHPIAVAKDLLAVTPVSLGWRRIQKLLNIFMNTTMKFHLPTALCQPSTFECLPNFLVNPTTASFISAKASTLSVILVTGYP